MPNTPPLSSGLGITLTFNSKEFNSTQIAITAGTLVIGGATAFHYTNPIVFKPLFSYIANSAFETPVILQQISQATSDISATTFKLILLGIGLPIGLKVIARFAQGLAKLAQHVDRLIQMISDWLFNQTFDELVQTVIKALAFYALLLFILVPSRLYGVI